MRQCACIHTYTMVVIFDQSDCAIGLINRINPIDNISTQTCCYVSVVVFTYRANTSLHVIHVSHYMYTCAWYKSVAT